MMYAKNRRERERSRCRIDSLIAQYLDWCELHYDSREPANHRCALARLAMAGKYLDLATWYNALRLLAADELSASYKRGCHRRWLAMIAWAVEHELLDASTLQRLKQIRFAPRPRAHERVITIDTNWCEQFRERFWSTIPLMPAYMRDFSRLLYHTGARPKEIRTLTSRCIETHQTQRVIVLQSHKTAARTRRPRYIALNRPARLIIDRLIMPFCPDDYLFPAPKDRTKHLSANTVQQSLRRTLQRNKLPHWTLYDCRRHAASIAVSQASPAAARALLGHRDLRTTSLYAIPSLDDAMLAADTLEAHDA